MQLAEQVHRRLVAWRWMALRFPEVYRDSDAVLAESRWLNEWIEAVLARDRTVGCWPWRVVRR
jgi:ATP-dependent RNA helicase SUPV3L1/SUV3